MSQRVPSQLRPSQLAAFERLWALVPAWSRAEDERNDGGLLNLLRALGLGLDAARNDVLRVLDNAFVDTCQPEVVPLIGHLVGVEISTEIPVARQRLAVKRALSDRARRGTVEGLGNLSWDVTGARCEVLEQRPPGQSESNPPRALTITAQRRVQCTPASLTLGGASVRMEGRIVRPVRRRQQALVSLGARGLFGIARGVSAPLAAADGTCLLLSDDAAAHVGAGSDISLVTGPTEVGYERVSFGALREGAVPPSPPGWVLVDPRNGRVGLHPASPVRHLSMSWWEPLGAVQVKVEPVALGGGLYAFAETRSASCALVDAYGRALTAMRREAAPDTVYIEQLDKDLFRASALGAEATVQHMDASGLRRFFAFQDRFGWDRYRRVRLGLSSELLDDNTVEVDIDQGLFRIAGRLPRGLQATVYRSFRADAQRAALLTAATGRMPIGRTLSVRLDDRGHRHPEVAR